MDIAVAIDQAVHPGPRKVSYGPSSNPVLRYWINHNICDIDIYVLNNLLLARIDFHESLLHFREFLRVITLFIYICSNISCINLLLFKVQFQMQ